MDVMLGLPLANTVHLSPPASSPHHNCRHGCVDTFVRDNDTFLQCEMCRCCMLFCFWLLQVFDNKLLMSVSLTSTLISNDNNTRKQKSLENEKKR